MITILNHDRETSHDNIEQKIACTPKAMRQGLSLSNRISKGGFDIFPGHVSVREEKQHKHKLFGLNYL